MRTHTNDFKTNIAKFGREIDVKLNYELDGDEIELDGENIYSVSLHYEGGLLKSVMRQLDIDSIQNIPLETVINVQFGLKIGLTYEYITLGDFVVYSVEKQEDTNSYKIICYDKLLVSMKDYEEMNITYPITISDYIDAICDHLGLTFKNSSDTFPNYDKEIQNELYLDENGRNIGYTFRDVFDELAQVTARTICINEDDGELELRSISNTNDTIDEEYLKNINVNFGEKFGKVNSIVLTRSGGSDSVYLRDEESVLENGLCEVKIEDNQIMNFNDRSDYLPDILDELDGLEFYINDFSSTGVVYYDLLDRYNVSIGENTYSCVMFNDEINITQGLEENIVTEMPDGAKTDYDKSDKTDRRINQAYIIVNKQNQTIEALTATVNTIDTTSRNNYQELITKFDDYVPQSQFITVENTVTQLQTDTYTKTQIDTKLTDGSVTKVLSTAGTFDQDGLTIEKTDAKTKGNFNEAGITVMDATGSTNSELLFAGYDENLNETIVRTKNINVSKYLTIGNNSRIEDYEDGTGVFYIGG